MDGPVDEVELESMQGVMYSLAALDTVVFLAATHHYAHLIYSERKTKQRVPNRGEKTFHITIMVCSLVRALFFYLQPSFLDRHLIVRLILASIWSHTQGLLLLLAYFMLFVVWMNFYYIVEGSITFRQRLFLFILFGLFTLVIPGFLVAALAWAFGDLDVEVFNTGVSYSFASLNILVALGIIFYGIKLFSRTQIKELGPTRKRQCYQIAVIVTLCTVAYGTKASLTLFHGSEVGDLDRQGHEFFELSYIVTFVYFFCLETFPLSMMVTLLWFIPEWKTEDEEDQEEQTSLLDREATTDS